MGSHERWAQPDGFYPNGLLPDETASVTQMLDLERWSIAEDRIAELIVHIQPNQPSEAQRNAVANYVQQLITKFSSCQVCIFGSVPLKTYLPDGDIDLTAFSTDQNLKDTWASEVRSMLENEEKRESAEFCVKEVQYIQAEVKIIKCLVENIVVDISFNQLGGLSTLCFLEVVDNLINQNHLFKRSVILIKAWCYYESRILGAHHGLISTYALETLVLYIFHLFNNDFTGPLEVLYRFLEFFSKFDWENFCVSLWGPVPIGSLPKVIVQSPRKDGGELLLSKAFYHACTTHSAFPGGQENNEQPFISKHFNVIDPLRTNNNLGRSVSKGNFFRIRSAFAFGAERLARLLDCPKESINAEVDQFFLNTWKRHGKGYRPDAPNYDNLYGLRPLNTNHVNGSAGNLRNSSSSKKVKEKSTGHDSKPVENHGSRAYNGVLLQQGNQLFKRTINNMADSQSQKKFSNLNSSATSDRNHQVTPGYKSNINGQTDNGRNCRPDYARDKINSNYQFAKTHSSPELKERYNDNSYQDRHCRAPESIKDQTLIAKLDYNRRNFGPEASDDNGAGSSREEVPSSRQFSSLCSIDPNSASNRYCGESGSSSMREDQMQMHQDEQDLVNMMASSRVNNLSSGHVQMPYNLASSHLPALASLGYANRNSGGMVPNSIEMPWASHMYYSQGLVSMPVTRFTSRVGMGAPHHQQEIAEPIEDCFIPKETYHDDGDNGQWSEWNENAIQSCHTADDESFQGHKLEERKPLTSTGSTNISAASHLPSHENFLMKVHGSMKDDRGAKENYGDSSRHQNTRRTQATSSMSKLSSEGSCDGLSLKSFKSAGDNSGGRKSVPSTTEQHSTVHNHGWQHETDSVDYVSPRADDDSGEWVPIESDVAAEDMVPETVAPLMRFHQRPSYEPAELSGLHSVVPVASVPVGSSDSRQRIYDNNGALPFAFYPTGPPVPFVTMLPFYNFPTEVGTSDGSRSCSDRDDDFNKSHSDPSRQRLYENLEQPQSSSSQSNLKGTAASVEESSGELKPDDILTGDFTSHWQNLQYGRFCQNPQNQGPMVYPPPSVGASAPMYIQGQLPWDGPGRPLCANANLFTQLMGYGPGAVPVSPLQADSNRPGSAYQSSGDELPRYRAGTGTYLPNPKNSSREWQSSSNARNSNRGNYSKNYYHGDRGDLNWNNNSAKQQQRFSGRGQGRNHSDKPNNSRIDRSSGANTNGRSDRPWDSSYRPDKKLQNLNHSASQNGPPIHSSSSNSSLHGHGPTTTNNNVAAASYGMYHHPLPVMNNNPNGGVAPPSASTNNNVVPSVVMFYPPSCDQNMALGEQRELKFGSIGPIQLGESSSQHRNFPVDSGHSSPDLLTSPLHQQR